MEIDFDTMLKYAINACLIGGFEILDVFYNQDIILDFKADESPVTSADRKSHEKILEILKPSNLPILSEEGEIPSYEVRKNWELYWLIDPLDGTKEFLNRNGEFTVNVALIYKQKPILGVIYVPMSDELFWGDIKNGAYKNVLKQHYYNVIQFLIEDAVKLPNCKPNTEIVVVKSRSHKSLTNQDFIKNLKIDASCIEVIECGSSLKFCLIAEGKANMYPRFSPTMEWDIAAGHAIAEAAGAKIINADTKGEVIYNKEDLHSPNFIVTFNE